MSLFLKKYKLRYLISTIFFIGACTPAVTPVEQLHQAQKVNNKESTQPIIKQVEKASEIVLYRCNNGKKVEIERQKEVKKSVQKEAITVNFQGTAHTLSSAVTKDGKKYTNIRWTWHETRKGVAFLYNNTKKTLAANCIKQ